MGDEGAVCTINLISIQKAYYTHPVPLREVTISMCMVVLRTDALPGPFREEGGITYSIPDELWKGHLGFQARSSLQPSFDESNIR